MAIKRQLDKTIKTKVVQGTKLDTNVYTLGEKREKFGDPALDNFTVITSHLSTQDDIVDVPEEIAWKGDRSGYEQIIKDAEVRLSRDIDDKLSEVLDSIDKNQDWTAEDEYIIVDEKSDIKLLLHT